MIKRFFLLVLFLACCLTAFTQQDDKKVSVGLGAEWNMDSRHNFAGGALLVFDYRLPRFAAVGLMLEGSSNFSTMHVIEPAVLFRAYFLENEYRGFYFQTDLGTSIIFEDGRDVWFRPMAGMGIGYRVHLGSTFYLEPFGRLGFPFAVGLGLVAGLRL